MAAPTTLVYGPANVDESLTLSWTNLIPGIRDNVFNGNNALKYFYKKNKIKKRGGVDLSHGIMYATNSTASSYSRYGMLDTTPQDGLTRDRWDWAQYAVSISIDGFTERIANAGDSKIEDALEQKKRQAELGLSNLLEGDIFKASPGANDMRSLPVIILASGTEGDINGGTTTWWQSSVTASGSFAGQGRADLTALWNTLSIRNPVGGPTLFLSDQTSIQFYESSLVAQERFTDNKMVDIGIRNLLFKDTPWTWSNQATAGVIYALHDDSIDFIVNTDTDFITTPFVKPANQDAKVAQMFLACALTTGTRRKLGKMTGVTA